MGMQLKFIGMFFLLSFHIFTNNTMCIKIARSLVRRIALSIRIIIVIHSTRYHLHRWTVHCAANNDFQLIGSLLLFTRDNIHSHTTANERKRVRAKKKNIKNVFCKMPMFIPSSSAIFTIYFAIFQWTQNKSSIISFSELTQHDAIYYYIYSFSMSALTKHERSYKINVI